MPACSVIRHVFVYRRFITYRVEMAIVDEEPFVIRNLYYGRRGVCIDLGRVIALGLRYRVRQPATNRAPGSQ